MDMTQSALEIIVRVQKEDVLQDATDRCYCVKTFELMQT